jgi:hypothetical protein
MHHYVGYYETTVKLGDNFHVSLIAVACGRKFTIALCMIMI